MISWPTPAALRARACAAIHGRFAAASRSMSLSLKLPPLDLEPFSLDLAEETAQKVRSLERHGDDPRIR